MTLLITTAQDVVYVLFYIHAITYYHCTRRGICGHVCEN